MMQVYHNAMTPQMRNASFTTITSDHAQSQTCTCVHGVEKYFGEEIEILEGRFVMEQPSLTCLRSVLQVLETRQAVDPKPGIVGLVKLSDDVVDHRATDIVSLNPCDPKGHL